MFSLVITVISIALVAVLALATLFYGGAAFNKGAADVHAATIEIQGQQLLGASELYRADHNAWPESLEELVSKGYLKTLPTALSPTGGVAPAHAAGLTWAMPAARQPVFVLAGVDLDACRAFNRKATSQDGVLRQLHSSWGRQCYSPSGSVFDTVVAKDSDALAAAFPAVSSAPLPTDPYDWAVAPGQAAPSGPPPSTNFAFENASGQGQSSLAFEPTLRNETSPSQTVFIRNTGSEPLRFASAPTAPAPFAVTSTTCGSKVEAGQACTVTLVFSPTAEGTFSGEDFALAFSANAAALTLPLSGATPVTAGEVAFTTPGAYTWVVPSYVTSVSAVAVGGGQGGQAGHTGNAYEYGGGNGGKGGSLTYSTFSVTPGQTLTITVGERGIGGSSAKASGTLGGSSFIHAGAQELLYASGGGVAGVSGRFAGTGASNPGGIGGSFSDNHGGGGGGAGGYSGVGGNGGSGSTGGTAGTGGAGGGGGGGWESSYTSGGAGGGVGIFGQGQSGLGGRSQTPGERGGDGSGGTFGLGGGGGGLRSSGGWAMPGAVRIIWGTDRSFPNNAQALNP